MSEYFERLVATLTMQLEEAMKALDEVRVDKVDGKRVVSIRSPEEFLRHYDEAMREEP